MIKRAHECPKSIFKQVQDLTDYDYFLVHLFETDPDYFELAKQAVADGREVILDSSTFELGKAFDMERYAYWIEELNPTYYVIPDALDNMDKTKSLAERWMILFAPSLPGHMIGVVQGKNYNDCVELYKWFDQNLLPEDKIAFSFDSKWYEWACPHPNKLVSWCFGRIFFINKLMQDGIINRDRKHHLLGCSLPAEFKFYDNISHRFIDSVDTCSPVMAAISGLHYTCSGLYEKPKTKMCDIMDKPVDETTMGFIEQNIGWFKSFCDNNYYRES